MEYKEAPGLNVLSLFDGISCGRLALERAGVSVKNYYASEIDADAIQIAQKNFPDTIQLGGVQNLDLRELPRIDLLIGGSPCQDLSRGKPSGRGLSGESSGLFWDYVKVLKTLRPAYFLLENVKMKREWEQIITKELGVDPVLIDSNLVSAQNRARLYWTNIPNVTQPKDRGLVIRDILYDNSYGVFTKPAIGETKRKTKNYVQWDSSGKGHRSQCDRAFYQDGKSGTVSASVYKGGKLNIVLNYKKNIMRQLAPIEAERLQTLPDGYTDGLGLSKARRLKPIGNGWTVDVISHILKGIKQRGPET